MIGLQGFNALDHYFDSDEKECKEAEAITSCEPFFFLVRAESMLPRLHCDLGGKWLEKGKRDVEVKKGGTREDAGKVVSDFHCSCTPARLLTLSSVVG